jgi:hypothetical protein
MAPSTSQTRSPNLFTASKLEEFLQPVVARDRVVCHGRIARGCAERRVSDQQGRHTAPLCRPHREGDRQFNRTTDTVFMIGCALASVAVLELKGVRALSTGVRTVLLQVGLGCSRAGSPDAA